MNVWEYGGNQTIICHAIFSFFGLIISQILEIVTYLPFSSELPSTTKVSSLGLIIFLQLLLVLYFSCTWLKEERLSKYSWIQAIQRDLWPAKIVLISWIIQALFQLSRSFIPRPPSTLEEQILFQLTLAPLVESSLPFQKKKNKNTFGWFDWESLFEEWNACTKSFASEK